MANTNGGGGQTDWKPIHTAPLATRVMLWWVGADAPDAAHCAIFAHVTYYEIGSALTSNPVQSLEPTSYWDGYDDMYKPLAWVTHWAPSPSAPARAAQSPAERQAQHIAEFGK